MKKYSIKKIEIVNIFVEITFLVLCCLGLIKMVNILSDNNSSLQQYNILYIPLAILIVSCYSVRRIYLYNTDIVIDNNAIKVFIKQKQMGKQIFFNEIRNIHYCKKTLINRIEKIIIYSINNDKNFYIDLNRQNYLEMLHYIVEGCKTNNSNIEIDDEITRKLGNYANRNRV